MVRRDVRITRQRCDIHRSREASAARPEPSALSLSKGETLSALADDGRRYSHSMVAGGFDEMSYTTRLMPRTSLMMRDEILASRS
jgi:hypothetical protein